MNAIGNIFYLKKVTEFDVELLRTISIKTFTEAFSSVNSKKDMDIYINKSMSTDQLTKEAQNPLSEFYFCMYRDEVIGYLKLNIEQKDSGNSMEIERIYLLAEYHGHGVAHIMIQKSIEVAKKIHADYIWLGVWEHNQKAIKFYSKFGFVAFGTHVFMLGTDAQNDILMKLTLNY